MNRLILSCVFCLGLAAASTGHDTEPHELEHGPLVDAKGIVYNDVNGNRKLDDGEAGIPGIRVSNGRQIVKTNDQGAYSLLIDNDDIIFVIKPRDWVTPLNKNKLPQFFYIHKLWPRLWNALFYVHSLFSNLLETIAVHIKGLMLCP